MSRGLNKVLIIGRVGRDPEMRYTPSGRPVTTFSVGTTRTWNTAEGERRSETEWFTVVAWSNLAEICKQFLSRDRLVYIEGRLQTRHWEDQDGNKHSATEIVANEMIMLDERPEGNANRFEQGALSSSGRPGESRATGSDLPAVDSTAGEPDHSGKENRYEDTDEFSWR